VKLIYSAPTDHSGNKRVTVRSTEQAEGTRDVLWLVKWPGEPGWSVQTPMINEPGVWHRGEGIVHGSAGLTLNEAKRLAHLWLHHGGNREALTSDPRFQRLYAAVVGRREVQA
jgi:hypothetical protein